MVACEMCGLDTNNSLKIRVAGSVMTVCGGCKKMGSEVDSRIGSSSSYTFKHRNSLSGNSEDVVSNYFSLISSALSKKGLTVQHLARAVNIKDSSLSKYVSGKLKPDVEHARKIGKFLDINLIVESSSDGSVDLDGVFDNDTTGNTLGDLLKKSLELKK